MKRLAGLDYEERGPLKEGEVKSVVVLLHGLGSNAQDLIGLAPHWEEAMPHTLFVSPNAPYPLNMHGQTMPNAYQWFSLEQRDHNHMMKELQQVKPILDGFLNALLQEYKLEDDKLAVTGFSQGCMMALYTMPRRSASCAGVLGYSGALFDDGQLEKEAENPGSVVKMPVTLIHGTADDVVPFSEFEAAGARLNHAGFDVEGLACQGLGHSIDGNGLQKGGEFLAKILG